METIGFIELSSIVKGIEASDGMLKAAQVRLIASKPSCPGKYLILVSGEVAAVQASVEIGCAIGGGTVLDHLVIPRVHPQVIEAINQSAFPDHMDAVGALEYFSVTGAILGADAAVKAAAVSLLEIRLGTGIGGKSFVILTGDVASTTEAVACGAAAGEESGMLVGRVVIPSPHADLVKSLY